MKKRIISALLAVLILMSSLMVINVSAAEEEGTLPNYTTKEFESAQAKIDLMTNYAENSNYILYVDDFSGEVALYNKITGQIMLSNPYDAKDGAEISQIDLVYTDLELGKQFSYSSYKDSSAYGQVTVEKTENGAKVSYVIGEKKREMLIPYVISLDNMNDIKDKLMTNSNGELTKSKIKTLFSMYNFKTLTVEEDGETPIRKPSQAKRDSYIKEFGMYGIEQNPIYVLDVDTSQLKWKTLEKEIIKYYPEYTLEKMHEQYAQIGYEYTPPEEKATFTMALEYELVDDGFNVKLDASKFEYDQKSFRLDTVSVLPYMNAASRGEKGYAFIPDGSGTIIRYEEIAAGRSSATTVDLYGNDNAYYNLTTKNVEQRVLPVFGNATQTTGTNPADGMFAIIENGDSLASITSKNTIKYCGIYATFLVSPVDKYNLSDSSSSGMDKAHILTLKTKEPYKGVYSLKYTMLTSDAVAQSVGMISNYDTTYIGMAEYYRDYLMKNGAINKIIPRNVTEKTKLFLEVLGASYTEEKFLSFPVTVSKALTTFDDVIQMHKDLLAGGINNMSFILTGFANDGLVPYYPSYLKWEKSVGGKKGLNNLLSYAEGQGVEIAPNFDFVYSEGMKSFEGFGLKSNATRTIDGRYTTQRVYYAPYQMFMRYGGISVSSASYEKAFDKFMSDALDYDLKSLAPRTLGSDLNSDFDEDEFLFREDSKNNTVNLLKLFTGKTSTEKTTNEKGYKLILDKGNAYSLPYASSILNAPLDSSRLESTNEAVPFYGIALHGSITFAGNAINTEGDTKYMFLKALESGANLYYILAKQNSEILKEDMFLNKYYSVSYDTWKDDVLATYTKYNDIMANKQDKYIVEHEFMNAKYGFNVIREEDGVALDNSRIVRVEYENGEGFILNYNPYSVKVVYEGVEITIPALEYYAY